jgi:KaiC/GvpD/RAD55 family RecA-like ATPase
MNASQPDPGYRELPKCPTGIAGLDEMTGGGVPRGRPTLVCGAAGCGKTLLAVEFLVRGATQYGEPGVFMAFEETAKELADNVRSLGFDLDDLMAREQLAVDHVRVERSEIEETGEYDLEGLFIRLGYAIDRVGAKRVVLDTVETLFGGLTDAGIRFRHQSGRSSATCRTASASWSGCSYEPRGTNGKASVEDGECSSVVLTQRARPG